MACLSLGFLQQLLIWLVIAAAIIAIIKLAVPALTNLIGLPWVGQIVMIICWAIVAIMVIYFIFALLGCLVGSGPPFRLR
ncbi:membrane protein implicated in regulation of membrane protease activity [Bradyrhizobium sp. AZCC 2176]